MKSQSQNTQTQQDSLLKFIRLFPTGTIHNPLPQSVLNSVQGKAPLLRSVRVQVPSRLNTCFARLDNIVNPPQIGIVPANSLNITVACMTEALVSLRDDDQIVIEKPVDSRSEIARHAGLMMQKIFNPAQGFTISVENKHNIVHGGIASSSSLLVSVVAAINHMYGDLIPKKSIVRFLAQNYGEESDRPGQLVGIPSIGGTAATSFYGGGLVALMGEAEVKEHMKLPENLGIYLLRKKMKPISALEEADAHLGVGNMAEYAKMLFSWGQTHGKHMEEVIYPNIILPAMAKGDLKTVGDTIFKYTLGEYGDITEFYGFKWKAEQPTLAEDILSLKELQQDANVVAAFVSSIGPSIVVLSYDPKPVREFVERHQFDYLDEFKPDNIGVQYL